MKRNENLISDMRIMHEYWILKSINVRVCECGRARACTYVARLFVCDNCKMCKRMNTMRER